ncbi:MAG: preprotein translocase subunit SecE [Pseudoflavonifractor sp.]
MSENENIEQEELEAEALAAAPAEVKAEKPAKAAKTGDKKDEKKSKPGFFKRIGKWFKEMKSELKKVQWPGWKQTMKSTGIVIVCVIVVGVFIWLFDALAHAVINALIALFRG